MPIQSIWIVEITIHSGQSYRTQAQKVITAYDGLRDEEKPATIEINTRGAGDAIADYLEANGLPMKRRQKEAAWLTATV